MPRWPKKPEAVSESAEAAVPEAAEPVEEAPVPKKAKASSEIDIKELLQTLFKETMPQMVAAAVQAVKTAEAEARRALDSARDPGERCGECGQYKKACKGKHRQAYIGVRRTKSKWAKFFSGAWINGVKYASSHLGQKITVPADSSPEKMVEDWEANEEVQAEGREAEFNTGNLSPSGGTTFKADARHHFH